MRITRNCFKSRIVGLVCAFVCSATAVAADQLYAPDYLWERHIAEKTGPTDIADTHLRIPYRDDGALDHRGHFTTFDRQDRFFDAPGLNCSGLVVSVCRFLFDKNWDLKSVTRDRQGNSGTGAALGKDWDFGWDLILNLTDGAQRRLLMPDRGTYSVENVDAVEMRGFDLHDVAAWQAVLSQMKPGRVYLGSISKASRKRGYKVLHYHVVLMLPDEKGGVWLYHATRRSHVHKMNVNTARGLHRLMSQFRDDRSGPKRILILEAALPDLLLASNAGPGNEPAAQQQPASASGAGQVPPELAGTTQSAGGEAAETDRESSTPGQRAGNDTATPDTRPPSIPAAQPKGPELVIEHRAGKVFKSFADLVTHIPKFSDADGTRIKFWFRNRGQAPRGVEIQLKGPDGTTSYTGRIPGAGSDLSVTYPEDFENAGSMSVRKGRYLAEVSIDGEKWCADLFQVAVPREAVPKIMEVRAPAAVKSGQTFSVEVVAKNLGAESDYGGITVSSPDASGLRLISAKPGKIYQRGSTVLSVTSDKIRTKVPMAERWIELWGENKPYDMVVRIKAGAPGTYRLYVRCALRGVNVKSSVVLMDPAMSNAVDQQGFPVQVHQITVR